MLELVNENHPILSTSLPQWEFGSADLETLSKDMFLLMWSNGGIGLAASQVGMAVRMFVMGSQHGPNYVCVNPEIIELGPEVASPEGCLTYTALWLNIKRPEWVHARYRTLTGETVEHKFEGLMARCYLHELDHLNGITFLSKVKPLSLKLATERRQKSLRKMKRAI
jgi:peptide deformylase